jgi:hypothetical protein
MKTKTIRSVIRRKVDAWIASITDESVRDAIKDEVIVSGGCITSMLLGEPINDIDIYFRTKDATIAAAKYYAKKFCEGKNYQYVEDPYKNHERPPCNSVFVFIEPTLEGAPPPRVKIVVKSSGVAGDVQPDEGYRYFETDADGKRSEKFVEEMAENVSEDKAPKEAEKFKPVFITSNSITLSGRVQIVTRFYGEPSEIHDNYDFLHCMCSWQSWDGHLHTPERALLAMMSRDLIYVGSRYPVCSVFRIRKFLNRGWRITAGQIVKIAWQIGKLKLDDVEVLEDQLIGVDSAYFAEIIGKLRENSEKTGSKKVDETYLFQLLDIVF